MTYKLPNLLYKYSDLEPFFDTKTMEIHHKKHHQNYINNTNLILQENNIENIKINKLISNLNKLSIPSSQRIFLRNNAGGHANHSFFWKILKKNIQPNSIILNILKNEFGNLINFKKEFEKKALNFFGSGWIWLIKKKNMLKIITTINQDNPLMDDNTSTSLPIIGLDLWEHAYYLKYQNQKNLYLNAFWNVLNWDKVTQLFLNK
ncbi:superoxide dismutase [Mn] [Enterobacteriaceae endosymbiont of Donacia bicoloricornis]|uniref:Fe-Mn family superoxide dismutase n=1 Tax=Enterobacteriaceae endosymbiont of Donacia bicoloricornis TaxID=2675772 RepID=UPI001448A5B1|nr:Fe-Mn family superoxide dismutase [Enterobacteriaceae endosymbiont of Donacia bicoloricornis]QJC37766.1 superoxide dismutase [Mn] [Enterobacteriaceae endosymbiont of Donacia bicoloricornis]